MLALIALVAAALEWRDPLPVQLASFSALVIACMALGGASLFYERVRPRPNFAVMCRGLMQVLLFGALGSMVSYLLARHGGALWDDRLQAWDRALGFDWLGYVRWVDAHPWLVAPAHWAYGSLIPQVVVLVLVQGFSLRLEALRATMLAAIIVGGAAILLSPLFPAVSNYVHLGLTAKDFAHVNPWAGYIHLADFNGLREGATVRLDLSRMQGIITFPSYHAALATVTLWGFCKSGLRWLQWAGSAIALATIASTPVEGGHYLVDVLAGIAIAALGIAVAKRAIYWSPPRRQFTAWPSRRLRAASAP